MTKRGGAQASLIAFDLLRLDGDDLRLRPIEARREALLRLVVGRQRDRVQRSLAAEGAVVFARLRQGLHRRERERDNSNDDRLQQRVPSQTALFNGSSLGKRAGRGDGPTGLEGVAPRLSLLASGATG